MSDNDSVQTRNWNVLVFMAGVVILFTILLVRLFSLQYLNYDENFQRSENNRLRRVVLVAERGFIYDRNGEVLVRNRPSYQIALQAMHLPRRDSARAIIFNRLLQIVDKNGERMFDSLSLDTAFQRAHWIKNRPIRILEPEKARTSY